MNRETVVVCECGETLEILWSEDFFGVDQITVKPHHCCLDPDDPNTPEDEYEIP